MNHCPMVAVTFVGSDTQHDRLVGEDERRAREGEEGWINKSHCHSLRIMPACVCAMCVLYVDVGAPALFPAL